VTSQLEGFCLPAVEAMASGVPVIAFSNSALPEVIDDGGVLVGDGDVAGMAAIVSDILRDDAARADIAQRAVSRAAQFSWARCADHHAAVLREAASTK
jgi:alpha-1,3-rhamnosyl/mannosyltransferase